MMPIARRPSVGWLSNRAAWNLKRGRSVLCWFSLFKAAELAYPHPVCIIVKDGE